ncbi:sodium channel protein Nach-like [Anoplophora glabripennis]|uniref:sodium channel protein Nach-like n=1 Tax=Anoplophora glabripennis TaxID=217634 RepID=UPI000875333C|nr:sodium channel protein Nach-like [Anoplophora glabripennis]
MKSKTITTDVNVPKNASEDRKFWSDLILEEAKQFCLNTALHGYRFIVLPKRILLERVIWAVICLASLISALTLLCIAWFSFQEHPTVSVTDSTHNPIWNYDFPAVTVCNLNKISRKKAFQLARNLSVTNGKNPEELAWNIRVLFQLINNDNPDIPAENYTILSRLLKDSHVDVDEALRVLAPTCKEMLLRCQWKGEERRCESIFEQIRTSEGFCCSFNYFALKNHSFTGIFASKAPKAPRRVSACGYQTGLEIVVNNDPEDYFATHIPSIGYRIFIDNPYYYPNDYLQNVLISMRSTNLIGVDPQFTYSTESLRYLPTSVRHCIFPEERALLTYEYNYHNCVEECKMNMTIKYCGCVPFKYLHLKGDNQVVCSLEDISCLAEYRPSIEISTQSHNFSTTDAQGGYVWDRTKCSCLPDCAITDYTTEKSSGVLRRLNSINDLTLFGGYQIANQSVVRVFFNDLVAKKIRWDVVFNWHTLLAYYGGLLGLFVGFSFVSGLEIIYFFTVRLFTDATKKIKTQTKPKKRGRRSKIIVHPVTYQNLDPTRLIIPSDIEIQRYKTNAYFFN